MSDDLRDSPASDRVAAMANARRAAHPLPLQTWRMFWHRGRAITPDQPWPGAGQVTLDHPLLTGRLRVPYTWANGLEQAARLDALQARGYSKRAENRTDAWLYHLANNAVRPATTSRHLFDHWHSLKQGEEAVVLVHGYFDAECEPEVRALIARVAERWGCELTVHFGQAFNIYYPSHGCGYEVRRSQRVRARGCRWQGW